MAYLRTGVQKEAPDGLGETGLVIAVIVLVVVVVGPMTTRSAASTPVVSLRRRSRLLMIVDTIGISGSGQSISQSAGQIIR